MKKNLTAFFLGIIFAPFFLFMLDLSVGWTLQQFKVDQSSSTQSKILALKKTIIQSFSEEPEFLPFTTENVEQFQKYELPLDAFRTLEQRTRRDSPRKTIDPFSRRTVVNDGTSKVPHDQFILFFGGAYILGYGVDDSETLSSQVQFRKIGIQVYNYAYAGGGPVHSLFLLRRNYSHLKFDKKWLGDYGSEPSFF